MALGEAFLPLSSGRQGMVCHRNSTGPLRLASFEVCWIPPAQPPLASRTRMAREENGSLGFRDERERSGKNAWKRYS